MYIQQGLKCNKGQYNSFGKYKYRSCEDILESVKPLLLANKCILTLSDELVYLGDRYYIKATATIKNIETNEVVSNTAYAREEETKKGMDGSQITGTSSSYARKYALNGLFCIDDTKDADTDEFANQTQPFNLFVDPNKNIDSTKVQALKASIEKASFNEDDVKAVLTEFKYAKIEDIKIKDYAEICNRFKAMKGE